MRFAISSLITSDKARGLFHQAILQSVGVMRPMSDLATAEQFGLTVGPDIAALRNLPAADLVKRLKDVSPPSREVTSSRGIGTIIDGNIVTRDDRTAYTRGLHAHMPIIVGTVANEGAGIARSLALKNVADLQAYVARNFVGQEKAATQAYEARSDGEVMRVLSDLVADTQYHYGTREMLRAVAPREPRLYRYVFSQRRNGETADPIHGAELQYPFENLRALHRGRQRPFNAVDENVAKEMTDAWARFAKTGDPNGGSLPIWPRYGVGAERYLEFGATIRAGELKAEPRLDLIREYYARPRP